MNYNSLINKPTLNHKELIGNNSTSDIGGMTEEQFTTLLETDLTSYYTKAQIDELFSRSYVYREKSGSIVTFDCPETTNGISEVTSEIVAVQDLHGYDNPWPAGGGKNKCNPSEIVQGAINNSTTGNIEPSTLTRVATGFIPVTASQSIVASIESGKKFVCWHFYDSSKNGTTNNLTDNPITVPSGASYVRAVFGNDDNSNIQPSDVKKAQVEVGQTATSYAPYSNICQISGWSAVNVYDGSTTDPLDATTYTTALKDGQGNPLTCYGGELSNENGVQTLTLTHGYIASYNGETLPSTWISDRDVYAEGTTPTTGAEVVYTLATPVEIPQDNLSIASSEGVNNIWCDTGDITVKALDKIIQG